MIVGLEDLPGRSGRVAMADGCFDPLHAGHLAYIGAAASLDLPLLVNVQGDEYIRRVKNRPPLLPETERVALLDALADVSAVHLCRTSTEDVLRRLRPAAYVKGPDWRGRLPSGQEALCRRLGIEVVFLDTPAGSSTDVVARFLDAAGAMGAASHETAAVAGASLGPAGNTDAGPAPAYAAVVTSHADPNLSGVARFSHLLAARLRAPCLPLAHTAEAPAGPLLLSLKLSDNGPSDVALARTVLGRLRRDGSIFDVFLHAYASSPAEAGYAHAARRVFAGNAEIAARLAGDGVIAEPLWCPELLAGGGPARRHRLQLFSFGMAHKVRLDDYARLRDLLERTGVDYGLDVSTAFHEKAGFGGIDETVAGLGGIFGDRVTLLGFLSDAAVGHFLRLADAFVAFFPRGVRANNTSVLAAMTAGRVPITDLDGFSPEWMRHGRNVLDLARVSPEDLKLKRLRSLGQQARKDAAAVAGWDALVARLLAAGDQPAAGSGS